MLKSSFGKYLKQLRISKVPMVTQEQLATRVHRNKMTICQLENGKNAPPKGKLLNDIIGALSLTKEEEQKLRLLAAKERNSLPDDVSDYFYSHPCIYKLIEMAKRKALSDKHWEKLFEVFGDSK